MRTALVYMVIIFISLGFLLAGMQTMSGYYSSPDDYGYHDIAWADTYVSVSIAIISALVLAIFLSRIQGYLS